MSMATEIPVDWHTKLAELEKWMGERQSYYERAAERAKWKRPRSKLAQRYKLASITFGECISKLRELRGDDSADPR